LIYEIRPNIITIQEENQSGGGLVCSDGSVIITSNGSIFNMDGVN
jgi:hypothetical protein